MKEYIAQNKERMFEELFSLLRIPSVSSDSAHKDDMTRCAERLKELLISSGADSAEVCRTAGHPLVFGKKTVEGAKGTILVYGHYDVQPADSIEKWHSDPFEPVIHDDAIWCRGANDDKGQLYMHLKAFEYMLSRGELRHNVKFIFEGEEEIGSPSLAAWAYSHREDLAADIILVSDTTMLDEKVPSINCGMRGLSYVEVKVIGPNKDLHSGHYGGAVANPINVLCSMISSLIDEKGHITVEGFYDDVVEMSSDERALLGRAPFDLEEYKKFLEIDEVVGEEGYSTLERTGIRPCLDVNGIWGGFTSEGSKTVLPSEAHAKISMRLVPNQKTDRITELFIRHFKKIAPAGVKVEVKACHGGNGFLIPIGSAAYKAASKAIEQVYGITPVPSRGGGSIPVLAGLQEILGADPLLMGFGLERDCIHSPNESYLLSQLFRGMESIALFYKYY